MLQAQVTFNLTYGPHQRQYVDVCVPNDATEAPLIICFHSGWFQFGQPKQLHELMFTLCQAGFACAVIGHRLSTDGISGEDILSDCKLGIDKAKEEVGLLGGQAASPCLVGSGVGGLLAMNLARINTQEFAGIISCGATPQLEAWDGCNTNIKEALSQFSNNDEHTLSPIKQSCADLPPLLILHGDHDPEVPVTLARDLHARCIEQGVESTFSVLSGGKHRFLEDIDGRTAKSALKRMLPWLNELFELESSAS